MIANRRIRLLVPLLLTSVWLCNPRIALPDPPAEPATYQITRSQLFVGDLADIAPHLDLTASGCVKLDFKGSRKLSISIDVWGNGKVTPLFTSPASVDPSSAGKVSITIREGTYEGKLQYKIIVASPDCIMSKYAEIPMIKEGLFQLCKTIRDGTTAKEGQMVPIWALTRGQGANQVNGDESVEEMAKRVEWALVVKVGIDKTTIRP